MRALCVEEPQLGYISFGSVLYIAMADVVLAFDGTYLKRAARDRSVGTAGTGLVLSEPFDVAEALLLRPDAEVGIAIPSCKSSVG